MMNMRIMMNHVAKYINNISIQFNVFSLANKKNILAYIFMHEYSALAQFGIMIQLTLFARFSVTSALTYASQKVLNNR